MLDAHRSPDAVHLCVRFLEMALLASVPMFVLNALVGAFRGIGDTRTPMAIFATVATHITGNLVFIYGRFGFPRMGVAGAGLALAISLVVGLVLYTAALKRHQELAGALDWRHVRFRPDWAWRILKIGIPAAVQAVIRTLGMMSFTGMLAHTVEGAAGVAALQIGIRAEAIAFMPGFGYSVAASALVGQSLGAGDSRRAERFGWAATWQAVLVMSVMAMLFFVLADWLPLLFTQDIAVRALAAGYLRINAACEPFLETRHGAHRCAAGGRRHGAAHLYHHLHHVDSAHSSRGISNVHPPPEYAWRVGRDVRHHHSRRGHDRLAVPVWGLEKGPSLTDPSAVVSCTANSTFRVRHAARLRLGSHRIRVPSPRYRRSSLPDVLRPATRRELTPARPSPR